MDIGGHLYLVGQVEKRWQGGWRRCLGINNARGGVSDRSHEWCSDLGKLRREKTGGVLSMWLSRYPGAPLGLGPRVTGKWETGQRSLCSQKPGCTGKGSTQQHGWGAWLREDSLGYGHVVFVFTQQIFIKHLMCVTSKGRRRGSGRVEVA